MRKSKALKDRFSEMDIDAILTLPRARKLQGITNLEAYILQPPIVCDDNFHVRYNGFRDFVESNSGCICVLSNNI